MNPNPAHIHAVDLSVAYPVYGQASRSWRRSLLGAVTGGALARGPDDRVHVQALDGCSFDIRPGDRVGLMGHNGAGKTTLLRVLAGALPPTSGQLDVHGRVASMLSIHLGMEPDASGLDNIVTRGLLMGASRAEMRERLDAIASFSGLGDYLNLPLRTYSSGMTLRLAFAVATSVPADIVLMDEWLNVGDRDFMVRAGERLDGLLQQAQILVLASHDTALLRARCNRFFTLAQGRMQETDAP